MTIFALLMPVPQEALADAIREKYPDDHYAINDTQWLISANITAIELCARLGIADRRDPEKRVGNAIVFATSSYYGRAPTPVWDWMKSKLETAVYG